MLISELNIFYQLRVQNAGIESELFPQYQYREIDFLDLKSLENKLRIASDEEKRKEKSDTK